LRYDDLCTNPTKEIEAMFTFLNRETTPGQIEALGKLVKPSSVGRFRQHALDVFDDDDRDTVRQMGFNVE
jgi:hypothetical protein